MAIQPAPPRAIKGREGSFLTAGSILEGTFTFSGPTIVSAHLKGDVTVDGLLVIEAGGAIEGTITGAVIIIHGEVKGSVSASEAIEAWPGCRLEGRAYAPSMRVDEGASMLADLVISPNRPANWDDAGLQGVSAPSDGNAPVPHTMFQSPSKAEPED